MWLSLRHVEPLVDASKDQSLTDILLRSSWGNKTQSCNKELLDLFYVFSCFILSTAREAERKWGKSKQNNKVDSRVTRLNIG
jgi:hypothetical protein